MKTLEELIHTSEYWMEKIQNEIYRQVHSYMENENLNQTQLATRFNLSKGYISQIVNGNFNFSLKTLIDLSLKLGVAPDLQFEALSAYAKEEVSRVRRVSASTTISLNENNLNPDLFRDALINSCSVNSFERIDAHMKVSYRNAS